MKRLPVNLASNPIEQRQWLFRVKLTAVAIAAVLTVVHLLIAGSLLDSPATPTSDIEAMASLRYWSDEVAEMVATADPRAARRVVSELFLVDW